TITHSLSPSYRFFVVRLFRSTERNRRRRTAAETTCNAASNLPRKNILMPLLTNSAKQSNKIQKILADMQIAAPPIAREREQRWRRETRRAPPPGINPHWRILQNTSSWRRKMPPVTRNTVRLYLNSNSTTPPLRISTRRWNSSRMTSLQLNFVASLRSDLTSGTKRSPIFRL